MNLFGTEVDLLEQTPRRRQPPGRRTAARAWNIVRPPRPSAFAESSIFLPPGTSFTPGRFSFDARPWWRAIIDLLVEPGVQVLSVPAGSQGAKSTTAIAATAWGAKYRPGAVQWLRESGPKVEEVIRDKLVPIYQHSPGLADVLRDGRDGIRKNGLRFRNGGYLIPDSVGSKSAVQGRDPWLVVLDELDKCILLNPKMGDLVERALKRILTWRSIGRVLALSTPSHDNVGIWAQWVKSRQMEWLIPCPDCGVVESLSFFGRLADGTAPVDQSGIDSSLFRGGIRWPRLADGEHPDPAMLHASGAAWYECPHCGHRTGEDGRSPFIHSGSLECTTPDVPPYRTAAHLPGLLFPEYSWSRIAAEFLAIKHNPGKLVVWRNETLALPQTSRKENAVQISTLTSLKDERLFQGTDGPLEIPPVPKGVERIFFAADAQKVEFWGVLEGVGYDGETWKLWSGRIDSKEDLRKIDSAIWKREDGAFLSLSRGAIDTGDGNRTHELYHFISTLSNFYALKGKRNTSRPITLSNLDFKLPNGDVSPIGITLYTWWTTHFQDILQGQLDMGVGFGPGSLHIPSDTRREWYQHIAGEHRVEDTVDGQTQWIWRPIYVSAPNHLRDAHAMVKVVEYLDGWLNVERPRLPPAEFMGDYLRAISGKSGA